MEKTEYPGMLTKLQPGQAVDILNDRVRQVGRLNSVIADWLQERSKLEEQYAAGLRKLARRQIDDLDLGIFSTPWSALTSSLDTQADAHSSLANKIEHEVEKPLRDFATSDRNMQAMTSVQGNLASIAKDIERAQQKAERLQNKGERAETNKVANATSDLENARSQWDSQAPYVFEQLQTLDEHRVNSLRERLTEFETLEADAAEKSRVATESCLGILLNVETADEIKMWSLKALSQKPSTSRSNRASFMPSLPSMPVTSRAASSGNTALSTVPSNPDDNASQHSQGTPEPQRKSGFKGLKRIGTVMSRRPGKQKESHALPSTAEESQETKPRSGPFGMGMLRRNKESYGMDASQQSSSSRRPGSPLRVGSEVLEAPPSRPEPASPTGDRAPQLDPVNIPRMDAAQVNGRRSSTSASFPNGSHQSDLAGLEPPKPAQPVVPTMPSVIEPPRDSEGYTIPHRDLDPISQAQADAEAAEARQEPAYNVAIRQKPIEEEGGDAALASVANRLQAPPPVSRRAGTVRGRRDARNSAIISTYGPPDQAFDSTAAPSTAERSVEPPPINTQLAAPVSQPPQPTAPEPSSASLVNSPSGVFSPSGAALIAFAPFSPGTEPQSPSAGFRPASASRALGPQHTGGDSQSIRSGRSTASQGMKHPDLHAPGLSSSIVETVSAQFDASGNAVSSSMIGEIAFAYSPAGDGTTKQQEVIRLDHFSKLDKVAPNPAFISENTDPTTTQPIDGEYGINLSALGSRTQVAFKYQLLAQDAQSHTPLLLNAVYKFTPEAAMIIIKYSLHHDFALPAGHNVVTLHNVVIAQILDGAKATGSQSKPPGTFNRERNLHFWNLGSITLSRGAPPEQLLVRFATDGQASGGHAEAKWEISGDEATELGSGLTVSSHASQEHDPFADESAGGGVAGGWTLVPGVRKVVSGSYVARAQ